MPPEVVWVYLALCLSAFLAGGINSVAGGGTLLTFPALISIAGLSDDMANGTSTLALMPGSLAGTWAYRKELAPARKFALLMLPVSLVGGTLGALLVVAFPQLFGPLVPWLILTAVVLFLLQPPLNRLLKRRQKSEPAGEPSVRLLASLMAFQFVVAVYGGYFGAGIGILMLTALGFMGIGDIHRMNAVKTLLASAINGVSVVVFVSGGLIHWPYAGAMAGAAILGGYVGARVARKLPPVYIRWSVIAIGFGVAIYYFATKSGLGNTAP